MVESSTAKAAEMAVKIPAVHRQAPLHARLCSADSLRCAAQAPSCCKYTHSFAVGIARPWELVIGRLGPHGWVFTCWCMFNPTFVQPASI